MVDHKRILIVIGACMLGILIGYFFAPARQAVAPNAGSGSPTASSGTKAAVVPQAVQLSAISIRDTSNELYAITGEYPQFSDASAIFNASIADFVNTDLAQFKQSSVQNAQARAATAPSGTVASLPPQSFTFDVSWEPTQINSRYISVIVRVSYFDGGANGDEDLKTFNYDVAAGRTMALGDLFPGKPDYLAQIAMISQEDLLQSMNSASGGNVIQSMIQQGAAATAANYANFVFDDNTVTIYFQKYQVAPGSFGEQQVTITRVAVQ